MRLKVIKPIESWQVFHAIKETLGKEYLLQLYGYRNARNIYAWCTNPKTTEYSSPNPIDKLQVLLEDLNTLGYRNLALATLKCLARPLGFEVRDPRNVETDKKDPQLEFLDVVNAIGEVSKELQIAMEDQVLEEEEKTKVLETIDEAIMQLMQLKDAVRKK